jgi:DNA-binding transcriptional regulator PaaX
VIVENAEPRSWVVLLTRVPTEPARHRMALWRELRRSGALLIGPSAWVVPDLPVATELIERVSRLVEPVGGTLLTLSSTGHSAVDAERLETLYLQAREEEWSEFLAD